jgi:hypothetical protein
MTDAFFNLRPYHESTHQTLEYIGNNPREEWIFKFVSMTELKLHTVRGRNKGCANANRKTIEERGLHETWLENAISKLSNSVDVLTGRYLDVRNQFREATANLYFLKKSKEEAVAAIDKARSENKMLDLQVELADKILETSDQSKPFGAANVTLKEVQKVMLLSSFSDIAVLNAHDTHLCIGILNNFGLLKNPFFRKLWEKKTPEEQREWESLHGKQPYILTGEVEEDLMKLRLANYLDIAMPVNESGDVSNDDDDPSISTTVGGFTLDSFSEEALEKELARRRQPK